MLSRYILNVGEYKDYEATEGLQNANIGVTRTNVSIPVDFNDSSTYVVEGVDFENEITYGAVPFSSTNYWWSSANSTYATGYSRHGSIYANSGIKSYVDTYATTLSTMGLTGATGTVLSIQELGSICSTDFTGSNSSISGCPNYVYETTYWLGSAEDYDTVYSVYADCNAYASSFDIDSEYGVRPVINVPLTSGFE